jgi:arabinan endo-1,5-alpha-L-arabinosidase
VDRARPLLAASASLVALACSAPSTPAGPGSGGTTPGASGPPNAGAGGAGAAGGAPGQGGGSAGQATGGGGQSTSAGAAGAAGAGGSAGSAGGETGASCDFAVLDPSQPPKLLELTGSLGAHDPVLIEAAGTFYMFHTGGNIAAKTSSDLREWKNAATVFTNGTRPAWLAEQVPDVESNLWAPDISFFGGRYHLYYSVSSFGSNRSCIGHLSRESLSSGSWTEHGPVICSNTSATKENWNAIDPNVVVDESGTPWLSFGSFWSGIKLIQLDQQGARVGTSLDSLANRPSDGGALEAPFIVRRCGLDYLFVSWDRCCAGVDSTYNIRVGRSATVKGPYVDRDGKALLDGGGTLVLEGDTRYRGPGHNAVLFTETAAYNVYHSYDADRNGASTLRISELAFGSDGWPVSAGP